jgi:FlaG/FlaF family flagellin (archaellin)
MSSRPGFYSGDRYSFGNSDPAAAVSEVIGSFLLISIVVLAVAIIAMVLFSQTGPQQIPNVNFMVGMDTANPPNLYIYHNGGDSLNKSQFDIMINNVIVPRANYDISGGDPWALGKNIIVHGMAYGANNVALVYNATGTGSVVIRSASANFSRNSQGINPEIVAVSSYPPAIDITQLTQNVNNRSIDFYQENGTIPTGTVKFNVTGANSTISTALLTYPLAVGSVVQITANPGAQSFRISGIGNQIWELNGDSVNVVVTNGSGGPPLPSPIFHAWITGYQDLQSNLTFSTTTTAPLLQNYTALAINNYPSAASMQRFTGQIKNGEMTDPGIVINNARPTGTGLFVLQFEKNRGLYFAGDASSITQGATQIFP